jgi:fibronectin type 3 domain-containing protein
VALSWTASTSAVTGYNTYSGTTSGAPYTKLTTVPTAATAYTDTTVLAGRTYHYVVTAVDSANNESAYSGEITATIP